MNAAQLAHAAKQNAVDRDFPYGRASFNGVGRWPYRSAAEPN